MTASRVKSLDLAMTRKHCHGALAVQFSPLWRSWACTALNVVNSMMHRTSQRTDFCADLSDLSIICIQVKSHVLPGTFEFF